MSDYPRNDFAAPSRWMEQVRDAANIPSDLTIYDGTLRKILTTAGLSPSVDDMLYIAEQQQRLGVKHAFMNVFYSGDAEPNDREWSSLKAVLARDFGFEVTVNTDAFVPMTTFDAQENTPDPIGEMQRMADIGLKWFGPIVLDPKNDERRKRMEDDMRASIAWTRENGFHNALCIADPARADYDWMVRISNEAIDLGVERLDLHDSFSSLAPEAARLFFETFIKDLKKPVPVTCHTHDDFGMASASVLSATTGGAHPDVSLLGVSYRSGFSALEEVVVALEILYGAKTGLHVDLLFEICQLVAKRVGLTRDSLKSVVGRNQFLRNLPLWAIPFFGGATHPGSLYDPACIGRKTEIIWEHNFSRMMLRLKATDMGLQLDADQLAAAADEVHSRLGKLTVDPRFLTDDEVAGILQSVAKGA